MWLTVVVAVAVAVAVGRENVKAARSTQHENPRAGSKNTDAGEARDPDELRPSNLLFLVHCYCYHKNDHFVLVLGGLYDYG